MGGFTLVFRFGRPGWQLDNRRPDWLDAVGWYSKIVEHPDSSPRVTERIPHPDRYELLRPSGYRCPPYPRSRAGRLGSPSRTASRRLADGTALAEVIDDAHRAGLIVVLDGKRNDIGSTAEAYADAYLGPPGVSPWGADALTVSPYLGDDSLTPFVETARQRDAGIFVLVKTSNPGGGRFQDLVSGGQTLYRHVASLVEQYAHDSQGECGYGSIGAVVGATYAEQLSELRAVMPSSWFLVPGYGAQGAGAKDVAGAFDLNGLGGVVNNSRGLIFAHARAPYAERFGAARWQEAVAAATTDMVAELQAETTAGKL
jgi:orotidine-5'-phosphate decarboxylase